MLGEPACQHWRQWCILAFRAHADPPPSPLPLHFKEQVSLARASWG